MGRAARAVCVSVPLLATAATAVLIVISTFIGQTNVNNNWLNSLYFLRLDTRYINAPQELADIPGTNLDNFVLDKIGIDLSIQNTANLVGVADFYQAGLFSYCSGTFDNATNEWNVKNCSSPSGSFYFNIIDIINAEANNGKNLTFPNQVNDYFKAVRALTRAQYICFIVGIGATGLEFILGFFGFLSRWGSCVTTFAAVFAFWTLLAGSVINIALYVSLSKTFDATFNTFGVRGSINRQVYTLMFIGVAVSFGAMLFWTLTTCCCSGRRDRIIKGEKASRSGSPVKGYERVASPYLGGGGPAPPPPHQQYGQTYGKSEGPYEPMRHTQV
ncbi:hypothetical protein TWF569_005938 [Orbilia oligospora]|uniref:Uncharacterized protein n=1 Tax=Orbilia oligospora TaxID=2813651 RepID=A0A7C8JB08_ORBOL|nr:hypothetical protein TWF102_004894 [Orbilia oligospora]KAF3104252.1 hypothetical protein TWF103_006918 [Orbilia oligospora]KAF3108323.1 hypothetical protein TWF706_002211 [Orbilia oligospora]KAF3126522.1 hypothetical protein TWF594_001108 [Orbilia oligospora]KAF3147826.1 hypothetical protein TWF569_005938 [Orbilia oligospora]